MDRDQIVEFFQHIYQTCARWQKDTTSYVPNEYIMLWDDQISFCSVGHDDGDTYATYGNIPLEAFFDYKTALAKQLQFDEEMRQRFEERDRQEQYQRYLELKAKFEPHS